MEKGFGPHLTIDLYGCNKEKLAKRKFIFRVLDETPDDLGLHKFSKPMLSWIPSPGPHSFDRGGYTGFVILVESHMAIHTFPADGFASFDIFSCKPFNTIKATKLIKEKLEAEKVETRSINRGRSFVKHYPRSLSKASEIANKERKGVRR